MTFGLQDGIGAGVFDSEVNGNGTIDWINWSEPQPPISGISDEEMNYIFPVLFSGGVHSVTLMFCNVAIARIRLYCRITAIPMFWCVPSKSIHSDHTYLITAF
jgi:hypothetical protein